MNKFAARYASQPTLPQGSGFMPGASPLSFRGSFPFRPGMGLGGMGMPPAKPNPLAQPQSGSAPLADAAGIQAHVAKLAAEHAQAATAGASTETGGTAGAAPGMGAPGMGAPGMTMAPNRPGAPGGAALGSAAQAGQAGGWGFGFGGLKPGLVPGLKPMLTPKMAMPMMTGGPAGLPPQPGATMAMPPGPPGSPPPPAVQPGQPLPPPPPGGLPPQAQPQGQPAGMPPGAGGPPGQPQPGPGGTPPPTAPLTDPMPGMLPANPRPNQPAPKTSAQALMEAQTLGLLEGKQAPDAAGVGPDMNAAGMAAGVKTALWHKLAAHPTDGHPQRSATGESTGLAFQHKDDDYAKGQAAWAATGKYFRGGSKLTAEPDPFKGEHRGKQADTWSDLGRVQQSVPGIVTNPGHFAASMGQLAGNAFRRFTRPPAAPAPAPPTMAGPHPIQKVGGIWDGALRGGMALGRKALPFLGRLGGAAAEGGGAAAEGGFGGLLAARRGFGMLKQVGGPGERLIGNSMWGAGKGAMLPTAAAKFADPATKGFFRMGGGWGATAAGSAPSVARHEIGHGLVEGAQTALGNGLQAPAGTPWLARQAAGMMNSQRAAIRGLGGIANETFAHAAEGRTGLGQVARGANFLMNPDKTLAYRSLIAQQSPTVANLWAGGTTAGAVGTGGAGVYGAGRLLGKQGGALSFATSLISRFGPRVLSHLGRLASGAAEGFGATNRVVGGQMSNLPGFFSPPKLLPLGLAAAGGGALAAGAAKQGDDAFADGFFAACEAKGLSVDEMVAAVEKAAEFAPEAAGELRAALEKRAGPATWLLGAGAKYGPQALNWGKNVALPAVKGLASKPGVLAATGKTLGGAVAGGYIGTEANLPGNVDTGLGFHVNAPGVLAGAAAMNPAFRRIAPGASAALRAGGWGGGAGTVLDESAKQFGVDTGGWGARLGLAGGLGVGAGRAAYPLASPSSPAARTFATAAMRLKNFTQAGWATAPRVAASAGNWMTGGGYKVPAWAAKMPGMVPVGRAGLAGTRLAGLGFLGSAAGYGMAAMRNKATEEVGQMYEKFRPQVTEDAYGAADNYLNTRIPQVAGMAGQHIDKYLAQKAQQLGMVDPGTGQVHPTYALFHAMGMDPTRMSPVQRMLMLGGGAAGVGGAVTGNPLLTALGGAAGLGGMAMGGGHQATPMSGWAASQLQPNEWQKQLAINARGG